MILADNQDWLNYAEETVATGYCLSLPKTGSWLGPTRPLYHFFASSSKNIIHTVDAAPVYLLARVRHWMDMGGGRYVLQLKKYGHMFVYRSCQCVQIIHSTLVAWLAQKEKERSGDRLGSANDRAAMIDILSRVYLVGTPSGPQPGHSYFSATRHS